MQVKHSKDSSTKRPKAPGCATVVHPQKHIKKPGIFSDISAENKTCRKMCPAPRFFPWEKRHQANQTVDVA